MSRPRSAGLPDVAGGKLDAIFYSAEFVADALGCAQVEQVEKHVAKVFSLLKQYSVF
ncbi:MAG: hypothetical protein K2Z81_00790 [Cyanobacteria bacterium]|nr:hypothetical protein [Cyanobacteriota bacterium]